MRVYRCCLANLPECSTKYRSIITELLANFSTDLALLRSLLGFLSRIPVSLFACKLAAYKLMRSLLHVLKICVLQTHITEMVFREPFKET